MLRYILSTLLFMAMALPIQAQIEWLSWEEAINKHEKEPKKIIVDVYTSWCGWCKKMDRDVFAKPEISKYISENFYAVKLDAEQKETIKYDGHDFVFDPKRGRKGVHTLAFALLNGQMSYPSLVYLDENRDRITISPGFKPANKYIHELRFIDEEHYTKMKYDEYIKSLGDK